jgi:hypothetical protein
MSDVVGTSDARLEKLVRQIMKEACREFPFKGERAIRQCERRSLPIAGASCRWEAPDLWMWRRGFLR